MAIPGDVERGRAGNKPTWIVFEGIDGSGKTTQAKLLLECLTRNGLRARYKHVFDSSAGRLLREVFIENAFSNAVEILILCATRQAFLDELLADEEECDVLLVDRFFLSIMAMQGRHDDDVQLIRYVQTVMCRGLDPPIIYYVDTAPEECARRLRGRQVRDRIEQKGTDFHGAVAERYVALLEQEEHVYRFDGNGDVEGVHRTIADMTMRLLGTVAQ